MRLLTHLMLAMTIMPLALAPQASAQEDSTSHMITYIEVVPAAKAQAATLLKELAAASKQDAGLLRLEILERTAPTNQFVIVEGWKDEAALNAHAGAAHAKQFRDKMQPHLMAPIESRSSIGAIRCGCILSRNCLACAAPAWALSAASSFQPSTITNWLVGAVRSRISRRSRPASCLLAAASSLSSVAACALAAGTTSI